MVTVASLLAVATSAEAIPDSDNDGINDSFDRCPQTWGYETSPFGAGCPWGKDANGNWCGPAEEAVNGECVPGDETIVTGTRPTPPPEPTGIEAFCGEPGNSGHEQCDGSSGVDDSSGGGGSGGGSGADNGGDAGSQAASNNDPNRPKKIQKAIDDALRCMLDPNSSEIARYQDSIRIEFGRIKDESVVAAYYCEASYLLIDEDRVNDAALALGGHWDTIMLSVLIHEFIHVDNHRNHGCPPWANADFAPSTKAEEEAYTFNRGLAEYERQTGRRSPFDPRYQRHHALIGCPSQQR